MEATHIPSDTILYLNNVSVSFDGFKAINNLSLYINRNELRCIIGPNGAGKTTMMDIITGKTRPDTGEVFFENDINLTKLTEAQIANRGIGRKFQKPTVFERHSVYQNLHLALQGQRGVFENLFFKLQASQLERIQEVLEIIGLADQSSKMAGELSHGQKQWLEIGMLLMQNPKLLLVDEPVAGMTHQESERTASLLTELAKIHSVVVVEHDMEFVRSIANKVTVLHQGSVLAEDNMQNIQSNPKVIEVYLGS
jgi:urea transport system ATP-binding protein